MRTATLINPDALYWASFNRFELRLTGKCVLDCSGGGAKDEAVAYWTPRIMAQIAKDNFPNSPDADKIRAELSETGAWDNDELQGAETNLGRLIWIAACNIAEEDEPDCSEPLKD